MVGIVRGRVRGRRGCHHPKDLVRRRSESGTRCQTARRSRCVCVCVCASRAARALTAMLHTGRRPYSVACAGDKQRCMRAARETTFGRGQNKQARDRFSGCCDLPRTRPDSRVWRDFTANYSSSRALRTKICELRSVLFLNSDRSRHPPRPCCKALRTA